MDDGLSGALDPDLTEILHPFLRGEISAELAAMEILCRARSSQVLDVLERIAQASETQRAPHAPRLRELVRVVAETRSGCTAIVEQLREGDPGRALPPRTPDEVLAGVERLFDWSVRQNEEASVALYSLGSPEILGRATAEVVSFLESWGLVGPERVILQIGCGIGRFEEVLSPCVAEAHGVDISMGMVEAARRRCTGLSNVHLTKTDGKSLRGYPGAGFHLVYAVDSFPYLVQSGQALVDAHFREAARVLRANGHLLILNYSYRSNPAQDREDIQRLGYAHGFEVLLDGERPFELWDGRAWLLRKSST
jgi:predicted TPR repeat methyltransferase